MRNRTAPEINRWNRLVDGLFELDDETPFLAEMAEDIGDFHGTKALDDKTFDDKTFDESQVNRDDHGRFASEGGAGAAGEQAKPGSDSASKPASESGGKPQKLSKLKQDILAAADAVRFDEESEAGTSIDRDDLDAIQQEMGERRYYREMDARRESWDDNAFSSYYDDAVTEWREEQEREAKSTAESATQEDTEAATDWLRDQLEDAGFDPDTITVTDVGEDHLDIDAEALKWEDEAAHEGQSPAEVYKAEHDSQIDNDWRREYEARVDSLADELLQEKNLDEPPEELFEQASEAASEAYMDAQYIDDRTEVLHEYYDNHMKDSGSLPAELEDKTWYKDREGDKRYQFHTKSGRSFTIQTISQSHHPSYANNKLTGYDVQFKDDAGKGYHDTYGMTGKGEAFEIFGNVVPATIAVVKHDDPDLVTFSAEGESRMKLYDRLVQTVIGAVPGRFAVTYTDAEDHRYYGIGKVERRADIESAAKNMFRRYDSATGQMMEVQPQELQPRAAGLGDGLPDSIELEELPPHIDPAWFTPEGWEDGDDVYDDSDTSETPAKSATFDECLAVLYNATRYLAAKFYSSKYSSDKYNDDQPRDEWGRWSGSGSFVSPNIDDAPMDVREAVSRLQSERQVKLRQEFNRIDHLLGVRGKTRNAVGAWADGAENSTVTSYSPDTPYDAIKAAACMKGLLAEQKAVLTFKNDPNGKEVMLTAKFSDKPEVLHEKLAKAGIEFHTLSPAGGGTAVYVYGSDLNVAQKFTDFAEQENAQEYTAHPGQGEFIGSWDSRAEGAAAYEHELAGFFAGQGRAHLADEWRRIRHHWRETNKHYQQAIAAQLKQLASKDFNPDQARDESGRWTSGGGSGGGATSDNVEDVTDDPSADLHERGRVAISRSEQLLSAAGIEQPETYKPTDNSDIKTNRVAVYLQEHIARQEIEARGIPGADYIDRQQVINNLWHGWTQGKGSTSPIGLLIQVSAAREFGGAMQEFRPDQLQDAMVAARDLSIAQGGDAAWDDAMDSGAAKNYPSAEAFHAQRGLQIAEANVHATWATSQFLLSKAGVNNLPTYRSLILEKAKVYAEHIRNVDGFEKIESIQLWQNAAASTSTDLDMVNNWNGQGLPSIKEPVRVVLRINAPREAVIHLPAFKQTIYEQHETIISGTKWPKWDAFVGKAPPVERLTIKRPLYTIDRRQGPARRAIKQCSKST